MTVRAVIIGLLLGLMVSVSTYYNDFIIKQPLLIGHLLPVVVLGALLLAALMWNPLIGRIAPGWMFSTGELAVIGALGLVACSWPDGGMYRTAVTNLAMPSHLYKTRPHWQGAALMAYVPGGTARLAPGHVRDWGELARRIAAAEGQSESATVPGSELWATMTPEQREVVRNLSGRATVSTVEGDALRRAINEAMAKRPWSEADAGAVRAEAAEHEIVAVNRQRLVTWFGDLVLPAPRGEGVLLAGGRDDPQVVAPLLMGRAEHERWALGNLPWSAWWPSIRLWGGAVLLVGLATFCMALIVHPQWAGNELLPYPIARFISEATERDPGSRLPRVAGKKAFWWAFGLVASIHVVNGASIWLGGGEFVLVWFNFTPLHVLFPNAARVADASAYFNPRIFFSAAAFACFLPAAVSFSLGVAPLLFVMLAATLISQGVVIDSEYLGAGKSNMLRLGAYLGFAVMIAYTGRRYYAQVAAAAMGMKRAEHVRPHVIWAARALVLAIAGAVALLHTGGLGWGMATLCVLLALLIYLVLTRIVAETGMFFVQSYWMPVAAITALLGFDAIGPTTYVLLAVASIMIVGDPRTALMPNLINALWIVDRSGDRRITAARLSPWLLLVIVGGFVVAGAVTLQLQYNHGILRTDTFTREMLPAMPFEHLSSYVSDAAATGTLAAATAREGVERIAAIRFQPEAWGWMLAGLTLFVVTAFARLRLSWWPLHPVAFAVWGTFPMNRFAASFLVGWLIKSACVRLGGSRSYDAVLIPAAVGVIAAEVLCNVLWLSVGAIYFAVTGRSPISYFIF